MKKLGKTEMRVFEEISGRGSGHPTHTHTHTQQEGWSYGGNVYYYYSIGIIHPCYIFPIKNRG